MDNRFPLIGSFEYVRNMQEFGILLTTQIINVIFVGLMVIGLPVVLWYIFIRKPWPGTLGRQGEFECEDPCDEADIASRKRDFCRIVAGKRDLWVFTPNDKEAHNKLPIEPLEDDIHEGAEQCYEDFKEWLKGELRQIPGATWESGRSLGWAVVDRVVSLVSVSPEFQFLQRFKIQPRVMQPKWLLMISKTGQVRVAWYAFVSDSVAVGKRYGPFVIKLVSEDLNADRIDSWCTFRYTCLRTSKTSMIDIIASQKARIIEAIQEDQWKQYYIDY